MKLKYGIVYFVIMILIVNIFMYLYSVLSLDENINQMANENQNDYTVDEDTIILSNSEEIVSTGYYLKEENGYIVVYLYDEITIFEETDILVTNLEVPLQVEMKEGKYIETIEQLYGFLENYSS